MLARAFPSRRLVHTAVGHRKVDLFNLTEWEKDSLPPPVHGKMDRRGSLKMRVETGGIRLTLLSLCNAGATDTDAHALSQLESVRVHSIQAVYYQ